MKTLLLKAIAPVGAIALFAIPALSHAETPVPTLYATALPAANSLIKGSGSAVYYLSSNGKRYVFPTEKTYFTWYNDFSGVQTISDADMSTITIGGNVTYRPGKRLIKITTDPRVYAVDAHGTLRHIGSEAAASGLYGSTWAKNVDDLPDAFFVNYKLGTEILTVADFSPATVTSAATSIDVDKGITGTAMPTPTPTPTSTTPVATNKGTLYLSKTEGKIFDTVNLLATANPSTNFNKVDLFFNGILTKTCAYSPCSTDETIPANAASSVSVVASFKWNDNSVYQTTSTITVTPGIAGLSLAVTRPEVRPGSYREVVATVDNNRITARTIEIYMDGVLIKACDNVQECRSSEIEGSAIGVVHSFYAIVTEPSGQRSTSETKTISVVANESPLITASIGNLLPVVGEQTEISSQAGDEDGVAKIEILVNGVVTKTCNAATCNAMLGPWSSTQTVNVQVRATDLLGAVGSSPAMKVNVR